MHGLGVECIYTHLFCRLKCHNIILLIPYCVHAEADGPEGREVVADDNGGKGEQIIVYTLQEIMGTLVISVYVHGWCEEGCMQLVAS
jgi:hypothetical protein